jgi:tetratricopeptide (TPR) repeat protein
MLDPNDADTRMRLAEAYFGLGDNPKVLENVKAATRLDFTTPSIHWTAATYFLALGDSNQAKSQMRLAVQMNRYLSAEAVRVGWSLDHNPQDVYDILPKTQLSSAEALHFFINQNNPEAALSSWKRLLESASLIEPHQEVAESRSEVEWRNAKALVDYFLNKARYAEAQKVWEDVCRSSPKSNYCDPTNRVVNGGFEEPLHDIGAMSGFDWRVLSDNVRRDSSTSADGQYGLAIDFDGSGTDQSPVMQWLNLAPNSSFSAHVSYRADLLGSTGQVRFVIENRLGERIGEGEIPVRRGDWREMEFRFQTPSDVGGAKVRILTSGSIKGTLWLDAITILPEH